MASIKAPLSRDVAQRDQSYPLTSIVQLVTFTAAMVICVDFKTCTDRLDRVLSVSPEDVFMAVGLSALLGLGIGVAIGLGQIRKWRGMFFCGAIGALVGVLILATYTAPAKPIQAFAASMLPLITTIFLRFRTL